MKTKTLETTNAGRRRIRKRTPLNLTKNGGVKLVLSTVDGGRDARVCIPRPHGMQVTSSLGMSGGTAPTSQWRIQEGDELEIPEINTRILLESIAEDGLSILVEIIHD